MKLWMRTAGIAVAAAAGLLIAWASTAPIRIYPSADAVIRISMGARPERLETCRRLSAEELENVLPQMRQQVICEGTTARYRLEVRRNDTLLLSRIVRGGGLRHDRQLYVARDLPVRPGPMSLDVRFVRIDTAPDRDRDDRLDDRAQHDDPGDRDEAANPDDERGPDDAAVHGRGDRSPDIAARARHESEERRRRQQEAVPADLRLEEDLVLASREVVLVTYDPDRRRLVLVRNKVEK